MKHEDFTFTSRDRLRVACYRWPASVRPVGIVQIAHGMGEHALRYAHVAEFLPPLASILTRMTIAATAALQARTSSVTLATPDGTAW